MSGSRYLRGLLLGWLTVLAACVDLTELTFDSTVDTGFLAVVTKVVSPTEVSPGQSWTLRIREASGTYPVDERRVIAPGDTVVFDLPPASYDVTLEGLPPACSNRFGLGRRGVVYEPKSTSIIRFNIECVALLTIVTGTDGMNPDDRFVYSVLQDSREVRVGSIGPNEQVVVDGIQPGPYVVELTQVDPRCAVLNDRGRTQAVTVEPPFSPIVRFRISCSRPEYRPELLRFAASRVPGATILYFEAADPGSEVSGLPDLDRFSWDVNGCDGASQLKNGPREFRGLRVFGSRVFGADTARVVFVLPGDIPVASGQQCMSIRVADGEGNTTPWRVDRLGNEFGEAPVATGVDVQIVDVARDPKVRFLFTATDADDDFGGAFVTFELRDGTLGPLDGQPEYWLPNIFGWDRPWIPDLRMVTFPFQPEDVAAVHLYLVDRFANATEYVDRQLLVPGQ